MESKRRKIATQTKPFDKNWEINFLFIEHNNQPQCLVCYEKLTVIKLLNIKRHYKMHSSKYDEFEDDARSELFDQLKKRLNHQQSYFVNMANRAECAIEASYNVALEIAKSTRSYGEGELIKKCAIKMAKCFGEQKVAEKFQSVSLSQHKLMQRVDDMSKYCEEMLKSRIENCMRYGLTLNQCFDDCNLPQLLIIVRSVNDDLNVTEDLLDLVELIGEIKGIDVYEIVNKSLVEFDNYEKLTSIATNGSSVMRDTTCNGFAEVLKTHKINAIILHCIIDPQTLCEKSCELKGVIMKVGKIIKFLQSGKKSRHQGKLLEFLEEIEGKCGNVQLNSSVQFLEQLYSIKSEVVLFLETMMTYFNVDDKLKAQEFIKDLKDYEFVQLFAFLCDIIAKLNELNLNLQGRNQTISNLVAEIDAFQCKLKVWKNEIKANKLDHFPSCLDLCKSFSANFRSMSEIIQSILDEFESRFEDFALIRSDLKLFNNPMGINIEEQRSDLKMELCSLQNDPFYLSKKDIEIVEFWKLLEKDKFPILRLFAADILSMFGSTYQCEIGLNMLQQKYRNNFGDLKATMRLALNQTDLDLKAIIRNNKG